MTLHDQIKDIIRRAMVIGHASAWLDPEEAGGSRAMAIAKLTRELEELVQPFVAQAAAWKIAAARLEALDAPDDR